MSDELLNKSQKPVFQAQVVALLLMSLRMRAGM